MNEKKIFKVLFTYGVGLIIYTLLMTVLIFVNGNYYPDIDLGNATLFINLFVAMVTLGFGLWTAIYAIMKKQYLYILLAISEGIIAFYLYLLMIVIAYSSMY